jgi:hypothetical protein
VNKSKKIVLSVVILLISLIGWGYFNIWRSPIFFIEKNTCEKFHNVLTMEQYGQLAESHERPYIIHGKNVLIFGSEHIKDSYHPQNKDIEDAFNGFRPTVVLFEGRL